MAMPHAFVDKAAACFSLGCNLESQHGGSLFQQMIHRIPSWLASHIWFGSDRTIRLRNLHVIWYRILYTDDVLGSTLVFLVYSVEMPRLLADTGSANGKVDKTPLN